MRQRLCCVFFPKVAEAWRTVSAYAPASHANTRSDVPTTNHKQITGRNVYAGVYESTFSAGIDGRLPPSRFTHQKRLTTNYPPNTHGYTPFAANDHPPGCWPAEYLTSPGSDAHAQLLSVRSCSARPRECGPPPSAWRGPPSRLLPATLAAVPSAIALRLRTDGRQPGAREKS